MFDKRYENSEYRSLDLSNSEEFITRIQGTMSCCISKLVLQTNLGQRVTVGDDQAFFADD